MKNRGKLLGKKSAPSARSFLPKIFPYLLKQTYPQHVKYIALQIIKKWRNKVKVLSKLSFRKLKNLRRKDE